MRVLLLGFLLAICGGCIENSRQAESSAPSRVIRPQTFAEPAPAVDTNWNGLWLEPVHLDYSEVKSIAEREWRDSRELITADTYHDLGFASVEEANKVRLGEPMISYRLDLNAFLEAKLGDTNRVRSTGEIVFPLEVDGQTRVALILARYAASWEGVTFGKGDWMRRVTRIRSQQAQATGLPLSAFSVVRLTPVNLDCIAYRLNRQLRLVPIFSLRELKTQIGQAENASDLVAALLPLARQLVEQQAKTGKPVAR